MSFARHETFYIRDGWLRKGIRLVDDHGFDYFKNEKAPDELGMGKNMVHSLRFWLQACGLVEPQVGEKNGHMQYGLSHFGKTILTKDTYLEDEGTLWLLHYHLATNTEHSTTWHWFFNEFEHKEFDDLSFLAGLKLHAEKEKKIAESSIKKDYQCFINTYTYEKSYNKKSTPEDNLNCPLRELKLLKQTGPHSFRLNRVNRRSLDCLIIYYVIKRWQEKNNQFSKTTISSIMDASCNVGKVFNLSYDDIVFYLEQLEDRGLLHVYRTAGLDSVILKDDSSRTILERYYERGEGKRDE